MSELTAKESHPILRTEEALMTDVILAKLFSLLPVPELKICRMVCQRWNLFARQYLSRDSCVKCGIITMKVFDPWTSPDGIISSTVTQCDVENWRKAKEFIELLNTRDSDIGISFENLVVRASLLAEFVGCLILHPYLQQGLTSLDITLYPCQLEWLKIIIPELKNLKKADVRVQGSDRCKKPIGTTPPPNFPKKYLGFDGEVPPTLSLPEEYPFANGKDEVEGMEFPIETLNLKCLHHRSPQLYPYDAEVDEFLRNCVVGQDTCFSTWILQRSPKLENLKMESIVMTQFGETLLQFSRYYRGKGFKSLNFDAVVHYADDAGTHATTMELLNFFKHTCSKTLQVLFLTGVVQIDNRLMLSSPYFPTQTLTTLGITTEVKVVDTDFDWKLDDNLGYTLTAKDARSEITDFLKGLPLLHDLRVLRNLSVTIHINLQRSARYLDVDRNEINPATQITILGSTSRYFANLYNLDIQAPFFRQRQAQKSGSVGLNAAPDLSTAFPALKLLTLDDFPLAWLNKALLCISTQLERIGFHMSDTQPYTVTDHDFLDNGALLRLKELRELFLCSESASLTDTVIYEGFLKLPKLSYLTIPFSRKGRPFFGAAALKSLELKPCFLNFPKD